MEEVRLKLVAKLEPDEELRVIREEDGRGGSFDGRRFTFLSFLSTIFLFFGVGAKRGSGGTLKELRRVFTMVEGMLSTRWKMEDGRALQKID